MTRTLVIDRTAGLYHLTNNGVQQYAPIRNRKTAELVAGYYKHLGFTVIIRGEKRHMPLSTKQQEQINHAHFEGLRAVAAGEKVHGSTINALRRRGFITDTNAITMTGRVFMENYVRGTVDEPEHVAAPVEQPETQNIDIAAPAPVITAPAVIVAPAIEPVANVELEEAVEVIHGLRDAAMTLGVALAKERVPELAQLFNALKDADRFLFRKVK